MHAQNIDVTSLTTLRAIMKYASRPKSAAVKDIGIDISILPIFLVTNIDNSILYQYLMLTHLYTVTVKLRIFIIFAKMGVVDFTSADMEGNVAVIPKVENIFVHTGNIVNWNRLKGTVSKSATSEVI